MTTITIGRRFRGPENSGNGGYTCGLIAALLDGDAEVTLRRPPPLERPLTVERHGAAGASVFAGEILIAQAETVALEMEVPEPPSVAEAEAASVRYAGFERHAFPDCFVCGPDRTDGLRIFVGPIESRGLWAALWRPGASLPGGPVASEFAWAALDCPGAWAVERAGHNRPVVLGRMAAGIRAEIDPAAVSVAAGWPLGGTGRKLFAGTALFDEQGTPVGWARQTWIVLGQ